MSPRRGSRESTAAAPSPEVMKLLRGFLPSGVVVNIGSGMTAIEGGEHLGIQLDHVLPQDPPLPFVLADATATPILHGAVGGVLIKDVLEHVPDPLSVLRESHRITREGGRLVVTVPRAIPRAVWSDVTHLRGFTRDALICALEAAGWTVILGPWRIGGIPGARRLRLTPHLLVIMRLPILGHRFGTNWLAVAERGTSRATP